MIVVVLEADVARVQAELVVFVVAKGQYSSLFGNQKRSVGTGEHVLKYVPEVELDLGGQRAILFIAMAQSTIFATLFLLRISIKI